jgi:hypothetical protein
VPPLGKDHCYRIDTLIDKSLYADTISHTCLFKTETLIESTKT